MICYAMLTKHMCDDDWLLNALTIDEHRALGDETVAYMSCHNLLYLVIKTENLLHLVLRQNETIDESNILEKWLFVPDAELISKYKDHQFDAVKIIGRSSYEGYNTLRKKILL